jgi:hypothetical protein
MKSHERGIYVPLEDLGIAMHGASPRSVGERQVSPGDWSPFGSGNRCTGCRCLNCICECRLCGELAWMCRLSQVHAYEAIRK